MQKSTVLQVLLLVAAIIGGAYVVWRVSSGWADWVVLGVIVLTVLGAARAIYARRYPTKKRTFVREAEPRERRL